jgi:hydrogenase nickel incorporation protein HypA/HybF
MHELSIAYSIIDIVTEEAAKVSGTKVSSVELEIGSMAGVETEALNFAWDMATHETILDGAPLIIHDMEAIAECMECHNHFKIENFFSDCPKCGSTRYELLQGKELRVRSFLVD